MLHDVALHHFGNADDRFEAGGVVHGAFRLQDMPMVRIDANAESLEMALDSPTLLKPFRMYPVNCVKNIATGYALIGLHQVKTLRRQHRTGSTCKSAVAAR